MADAAPSRATAATLAILAKAPIPGFAKTRLVPLLGAEGAAELHAILLERTLRVAEHSGFASLALWCAPDRRAAFFDDLRGTPRMELRDQVPGDLGARMRAAVDAHAAPGRPVIVVGTDCPELAAEDLVSAAEALASGVDAVLLPATDGGYAALGLSRADPSLFEDIPWGTSSVAAITRERLARLGWVVRELPPVRDVDVPGDVAWLLTAGLLTERERERIARHLGAALPIARRGRRRHT